MMANDFVLLLAGFSQPVRPAAGTCRWHCATATMFSALAVISAVYVRSSSRRQVGFAQSFKMVRSRMMLGCIGLCQASTLGQSVALKATALLRYTERAEACLLGAAIVKWAVNAVKLTHDMEEV